MPLTEPQNNCSLRMQGPLCLLLVLWIPSLHRLLAEKQCLLVVQILKINKLHIYIIKENIAKRDCTFVFNASNFVSDFIVHSSILVKGFDFKQWFTLIKTGLVRQNVRISN